MNTQTDGQTDNQTDGHTDGHFDLQKASAQRADALKTYSFIKFVGLVFFAKNKI